MIDTGWSLNLFVVEGSPQDITDLQKLPPILAGKDYAAPSVFEPENLLR
jgi:hypothetical protein